MVFEINIYASLQICAIWTNSTSIIANRKKKAEAQKTAGTTTANRGWRDGPQSKLLLKASLEEAHLLTQPPPSTDFFYGLIVLSDCLFYYNF